MLNPGAILVIEDDETDLFLLQRALQKLRLPNPIHSVSTGEAAIAYLKGEGEFADRAHFPFPSTIITDCTTHGIGGFGVLGWLQENPDHKVTPTIVFTGTADPVQVAKAYELGAQFVLRKPIRVEDLDESIQRVMSVWNECASLVPRTT